MSVKPSREYYVDIADIAPDYYDHAGSISDESTERSE